MTTKRRGRSRSSRKKPSKLDQLYTRVIRARLHGVTKARTLRQFSADGPRESAALEPRVQPMTMHKLEPEDQEQYVANMSGKDIRFGIWPHENISLDDAAREAAMDDWGPIAGSWIIYGIQPLNDAAKAAYPSL